MPGEPRVIEDGVLDGRTRFRATRPSVWIALVAVAGLAASFVVLTPTPAVEEAAPSSALELDRPTGSGVAKTVAGFEDALVAVVQTEGRSLAHLLWAVDDPPVTSGLSAGPFGAARFDSSGRWLATATVAPDRDDPLLSMGIPPNLVPLVSGVAGFAWHDDVPGLLAYTRVADGEWTLSISRRDSRPLVLSSSREPLGRLVAWGDWGYALQDVNNQVRLLSPEALQTVVVPGRVLDSSPDGRIAVFDGEMKLINVDGTETPIPASSGIAGGALGAALSPDGATIAVVGSLGLKVLPVGGAGPVSEIPFPVGNARVSWSTDSRFVIAPLIRGVVVFDTETGLRYEELSDFAVIESSVISPAP